MKATSTQAYAVASKSIIPSVRRVAEHFIVSRGAEGATRMEVEAFSGVESKTVCGAIRQLELKHRIVATFRVRKQETGFLATVYAGIEFADPAEVAENAKLRKGTRAPQWCSLRPSDAESLVMILDEYMRLAGVEPDDDRYPELCRLRDGLTNTPVE